MDKTKQPQRQWFITTKFSSPWAFFVLALGWSWIFWIPLALMGWEFSDSSALVLFILGGVGVPLAGIILAYHTRGREGWKEYWRCVVDFKRIKPHWYLVIFLLPALWGGLGVLTGFLLGEGLPSLEGTREFLSQPLAILPFAFVVLIYGPLPEELGWRGYALGRLQAKYTALSLSLILGVFWALWHVPQFFITGLPISDVFPVGTPIFWAYFVVLLPQSVLYTWIFNNNRQSTLAAILFHFMTNFAGEFLDIEGPWRLYGSMWIVIITVIAVAIWGPRRLIRTARPQTEKIKLLIIEYEICWRKQLKKMELFEGCEDTHHHFFYSLLYAKISAFLSTSRRRKEVMCH